MAVIEKSDPEVLEVGIGVEIFKQWVLNGFSQVVVDQTFVSFRRVSLPVEHAAQVVLVFATHESPVGYFEPQVFHPKSGCVYAASVLRMRTKVFDVYFCFTILPLRSFIVYLVSHAIPLATSPCDNVLLFAAFPMARIDPQPRFDQPHLQLLHLESITASTSMQQFEPNVATYV